MVKSRELVRRAVLQQERQPDICTKVHPVAGLDAEPCNAGRCVLDDWLSDRLAAVDIILMSLLIEKQETPSNTASHGTPASSRP